MFKVYQPNERITQEWKRLLRALYVLRLPERVAREYVAGVYGVTPVEVLAATSSDYWEPEVAGNPGIIGQRYVIPAQQHFDTDKICQDIYNPIQSRQFYNWPDYTLPRSCAVCYELMDTWPFWHGE